jgi:hypothetical protein
MEIIPQEKRSSALDVSGGQRVHPCAEFMGRSAVYLLFASHGLELESSHASDARMLPVANAIDESEAP